MAKRFSVEAIFKAVDRVTAPVTRMQNAVGKMTRSVEAGVRRMNVRTAAIGEGIKSGALHAAAGLGAISVAMSEVIRTGAEFEQTLTNAAAKFDGDVRKGTSAFEALEDAARKTGATTEFSATQSAEALNSLAMAGFSVESAIAALPSVVDLATAAQIDLATATDVAADSLGAFNLNSTDANKVQKNLARVSDVLAMTANMTNTSIEGMYETIKEAGPVATAAGISIETFSALAGELANAGIKGSKGGTTLKNMFLRLQAPTSKSAKMMKTLGLNLAFLSNGALDPVQTLENLRMATEKLSSTQKAAALDQLFGSEAIAGVNVLLASGTDKLNASIKKLEGGGGSIKKVADTMRNTLLGRFKELKSTVEAVKIDIFSKVSGPLSKVVEKMVEWIRANKELISSKISGFVLAIVDNLGEIVSWIKKIGISLGVFIIFSNILKSLVLIMQALNFVMGLSPFGLMVLGVTSLILGFMALWTWIDEISAAFGELPAVIKTILAPIWALIKLVKFAKDLVGSFFDSHTTKKVKAEIDFSAIEEAKRRVAGDKLMSSVYFLPELTGLQQAKQAVVTDKMVAPVKMVPDLMAMEQAKKWVGSSQMVAPVKITPDLTGMEQAKKMIESSQIVASVKMTPEKNSAQQAPKVVSPQERIARTIEEKKTSARVTIADRTGTAKVEKSTMGKTLNLEKTGAF